MGSFNNKYFGTKSGSLEESIRKAVSGQIEEQNYKPIKANHYDVKITVKDRDVAKVKKIIQNFNGEIEDVDTDGVDGGGMKFKGTGDIFIQGDDAGKLGMEIAKSVRTVKVVGEKLVGGQKKLDKDKDGDIDGKDFALLRKAKTNKESVEVDEGKMKQMKSYIDDIANAMKKDKMMKPFVSKFMSDVSKSLDPKKSLEKVLPDYIPGKDVSKLLNMGENFEMGTPENTKSKLDATPGQSADDWQEQVNTMQKKNASMREALAKIWGMGEGHNPFENKKEEKSSKKEDKTMTGKPVTKVKIDPDMKEVKVGKKNVR